MSEAVIVKLEATERTEGKNPRQIRQAGFLPVTLYSKDVNLNLQVNTHEFKLQYQKNKDAKYEISFGKNKYNAEIKNVQVNFATDEYQSVEFQVVK